jgi:mannose-6-phosphate isomerase
VTDRTVTEPGFAVLIVTAGEVRVHDTILGRGSTAVVPHAVGAIELTGNGEVLVARPPRT